MARRRGQAERRRRAIKWLVQRGWRFLYIPLVFLSLLAAKPAPTALPQAVAGWRSLRVAPPAPAAAPDLPLLQEFGIAGVQRAVYARRERRMQVTALKFQDASGAFGAFSFLRPEGVSAPPAGKCIHAFQQPSGALLECGNWIVEIQGNPAPARAFGGALGAALPQIHGPGALLPNLPRQLPSAGYRRGTMHYIEGPIGMKQAAAWLPAAAIGFDAGAEAVSAEYGPGGGPKSAHLVLISYPTPLMAQAALARLNGNLSRPSGLLQRSGPWIVAVQSPDPAQAQSLLRAIGYHPVVISTFTIPRFGLSGLPGLVLGSLALCGVLALL